MSRISPVGGGALDQVLALRQQMVDRSRILQEIHQPTGVGGAGAAIPTAAPANGGFVDTLNAALQSTNQSQLKADDISAAYERGETTDVAAVMLARQEAGVAFEATLQVRNKLLSAYQEIMRMGL